MQIKRKKTGTMKIAIVGSRTINPVITLPFKPSLIVSGGAPGVDTAAKEYAASRNIPFQEIKPDYARYNRSAPIIRNKEIVDLVDMLFIYWDGSSRGTYMVLEYAKKKKKTIILKTA